MEPILKSSFDYISSLNDYENLYENQKLISSINYIYKISSKIDKIHLINLASENRVGHVLAMSLKSCYVKLAEIQSRDESSGDLEKILSQVAIFFSVIRLFSNHSIKFSSEFHESSGISFIFQYLSNTAIIEKYRNSKNLEKNSKIMIRWLVRSLLGCLVNLSKNCSNFKNEWKQENSIELIFKLSEELKDIDDCQLACYIILANITEEDEVAKFPSLKNVLPILIGIIDKMAKSIFYDKNLPRIAIEVEDTGKIENVCKITVGPTIWHLIELMEALYKMAVNDSIKKIIYFDHKLNESLRLIIFNGNNTEIRYAVKLLWQLCFDSKISEDVYSDKKLYDFLKNNSENENKTEILYKNSHGCFWTMEKKHFEIISEQQMALKEEKNDKIKHIMISYNRNNRDLCLRIKEELEKEGHKIWIDVEDIHGSSLEAMAKAIEESKCVLMCMTENYKQSSNCRAEAEYAFQLNKPIIPLIMEAGYKPDGWLGIILGSKIFVNFLKYEYDECIRRVKSEINKLLNEKFPDEVPNKTSPVLTPPRPSLIDAENWSEEKVEDWLRKKEFNEIIRQNIVPSNGKILKQLLDMLINAPEFFYSSISSNNGTTTRDVAYFASELKVLFKNK
ncbi:unnamed protein product [Brachionus calyciflorus]|uniref:TIR domain-containing protein n=1 Tax=Brachionus calyciflorus TaxID=104777 RepID=A0A813LY72_9BILA|nr:unnamed protein product [Brachionus calyciflorus]